jgi:hypothetical protein
MSKGQIYVIYLNGVLAIKTPCIVLDLDYEIVVKILDHDNIQPPHIRGYALTLSSHTW